jgi:hypothetical protein
MNAAELKQCTECRRSYIVYAPLDYIDSGLCTPCENEWLELNIGGDAGVFANKVTQPDLWGAFLGLMIVLCSAAIVTSGIYALVYRWTR